jgi:hypothetical protein
MLGLIAFGRALSRKKLQGEMFFHKPAMEEEQVDQEEVWSAIRHLDPDEWDSIADGQCVSESSVVLALAMSVGQAVEVEEAVTLVGSVK